MLSRKYPHALRGHGGSRDVCEVPGVQDVCRVCEEQAGTVGQQDSPDVEEGTAQQSGQKGVHPVLQVCQKGIQTGE